MGRDPLDVRAERLLRLGLSVAALLRQARPEQARVPLLQLDRSELVDMVTLLAAAVDIEKRTSELVAWWLNPPTEADLEEKS
jgi:hypothetical protein